MNALTTDAPAATANESGDEPHPAAIAPGQAFAACVGLYQSSRYDELLLQAGPALSALAGPPWLRERCELLRLMAIAACDIGDFAAALGAAIQLERLHADHPEDSDIGLLAAFGMSVTQERMGDSWSAIRVLTEALAHAEQAGLSRSKLMAHSLLCAIYIGAYHRLKGAMPDAEALQALEGAQRSGEQALALLSQVPDPVYRATILGNLGEVLVHSGQLQAADEMLAQARDLAEAHALSGHAWRIRASMGASLLAAGQAESALEAMRALQAEMGPRAPQSTAMRMHQVAQQACAVLGWHAQAFEHLHTLERLERRRTISQLRAQSQLFVTRAEAENQRRQTLLAQQEAQAQRQHVAELALSSEIDPLTGLGNRRHFERRCRDMLPAVAAQGLGLAVAMFDIDHFKHINDRYGHAAGDQALKCIGELLARHTRASDIVVRQGGDEFVLVLADVPPDFPAELCERLRRVVADHGWRDVFGGQGLDRVTLSMGLCVAPPYDLAPLMAAADAALYAAKAAGRNRLVVAPAPTPG
jgi:diguanylate cyclase